LKNNFSNQFNKLEIIQYEIIISLEEVMMKTEWVILGVTLKVLVMILITLKIGKVLFQGKLTIYL